MVYKLEMLMHNAATNEACILGFLLFCLFASARFADATKCKDMTLEEFEHVSLIETGTMEFKSPVEEKKKILLPLLALGQALYGSPWSRMWFLARRRAGIEQFPFIMPAFSEVSGLWLPRRMTSVEGSLWLREFLVRAGIPEGEAMKFSSHSLKATLLRWSALHGSLSMDERCAMWLFHWCTLEIFSATYIASFNGCSVTSGQAFSTLRNQGPSVLPGRRHLNRCLMMHRQVVTRKVRIANLNNLCQSKQVSRTFQGPSCHSRTSSRADNTRSLEWYTFLTIVLSCHVADHGQETMAPHSLIFRKADGKPFASSVPRLSRSESYALGPI